MEYVQTWRIAYLYRTRDGDYGNGCRDVDLSPDDTGSVRFNKDMIKWLGKYIEEDLLAQDNKWATRVTISGWSRIDE